jgi:2-desacetyl-2-hydroxyethyl bacteriochlorophyllide A dehydrogenase
MKTIVLAEPGRFQLTAIDSPQSPAESEALVRVERIGVCGTDYHAFRGKHPFFRYPRVLGHELAVLVESVGQGVTNIAPGDLCAVRPYIDCGKCIACRRGKPNCCANLSVLGVHADGGMCERFIVPSRLLHKSTVLSVDQLALIEPLSIGAHAVSRAQLEPQERVLVIGAGPIGLATARFAVAAGASVMVADTNQVRLRFCHAWIDATECLDPSHDTLQQISALTAGDLPNAVFDCTGSTSSMEASFQFVAPGGRLIFVGLVQADIKFHDPHFHRREITLLASRNATSHDFHHVQRLMESNDLDIHPWITHRCPFDRFLEEFLRWTLPETGVIKGLIEV